MRLPPQVFETCASASSATSAMPPLYLILTAIDLRYIVDMCIVPQDSAPIADIPRSFAQKPLPFAGRGIPCMSFVIY